MKSKRPVFSTALGMLLVGWVATFNLSAQPITKPVTIKWFDVELEAVKTADNFIVLYNNAKTMGRPFEKAGMSHLEAAKSILQERHKLLPDLPYNAGLYSIAPKRAVTGKSPFKAYYPMQPYDHAAFGQAIEQLPTEATGTTEIQRALVGLEPILKDLSGKTVVFLFTDGVDTEVNPPSDQGLPGPNVFARTPTDIARELAEKYNVCYHLISSAPGEVEREMMRTLASINECSRVLPIESILGRPEYMTGSLFVMEERMFEVIQTKQRVVGYKIAPILFDFDSTEIKPEYKDQLNGLGKFLQQNPTAYVILGGFSDPTGSAEYNLHLSRRRVEGVDAYLQAQFNITPDRIVTLWYGDQAPVASNDTKEGRRQNRRVAGALAGL